MSHYTFYTTLYLSLLLCAVACQPSLESFLPPNPHSSGNTSSIAGMPYKDLSFTQLFRRTNGWITGDVAVSFPLNNGKSLWLFGDSHFDTYDAATKTVPCLFQVRNAAMTMGIRSPTQQTMLTTSGTDKTIFKYGTDKSRLLWPGTGFTYCDTAYVFQARIHQYANQLWGFREVDSLFVAKIHIPTLKVVGYATLGPRAKISFVHSTIVEKVGSRTYVYIYGIRDNGFGRDLLLARFPINRLQGPWEYYSGNNAWSTDIARAQKIHSEFTASFDVCKVKGTYVLLTTEFSVDCEQGKHIYAYVADKPYGPFINKKIVWTVDDLLEGHTPFFYQAEGHSEYTNTQQELLMTYCINGYGKCVNTCVNGRMNPDYYRPKAVRIPYSFLGL